MCMCAGAYIYGCPETPESDLLELELQMVVNLPWWVLGSGLSSPARAASTLTSELALQPPHLFLFYVYSVIYATKS